MAYLIKIGYIPKGKSTQEYVDILSFNNQSTNLPAGIIKIETNDNQTTVSLEAKYIGEINYLYFNQDDQETDFPIKNSQISLNKVTFDKIKYYLSQSITSKINQEFVSIESVAIWHLDPILDKNLILQLKLGTSHIFILDQCRSSTPLRP